MSDLTENIKNEIEETNTKKDYEILSEDYSEYDVAFKIIIIGNAGVGKSCLSNRATKNFFVNDYSSTIAFEYFKFNIKNRATKNFFVNDYSSTIAFEYFKFNIKLKDEIIIRLHIWDTCGQEVYRSLISNYYKNSSLAILVYSIDE